MVNNTENKSGQCNWFNIKQLMGIPTQKPWTRLLYAMKYGLQKEKPETGKTMRREKSYCNDPGKRNESQIVFSMERR